MKKNCAFYDEEQTNEVEDEMEECNKKNAKITIQILSETPE